MDPIFEIAREVEAFYERTMCTPDFVLVGNREWERLAQVTGLVNGQISVGTCCGRVIVRRDVNCYSMIAPVLEKMP